MPRFLAQVIRCIVIQSEQKNLQNFWFFSHVFFIQCFFSDIKRLEAAFQKDKESAPSSCYSYAGYWLNINSVSLQSSHYLWHHFLVPEQLICNSRVHRWEKRLYLLPLNYTEAKPYCYHFLLVTLMRNKESDAFCNASV